MITSITNKKVKSIVQLNKKAGQRKKEDVFLAEGINMFLEAPESAIQQVYVSEGLLESLKEKNKVASAGHLSTVLWEKLKRCGYETTTDDVFVKISDTQTPQGILCILKQFHYSLEEIMGKGEVPLFLLLESIQDPGNLGTIIRTGEGAGITGVLMGGDIVDIYNPKTIRSTMGSIYRVPFLYIEDMEQTIRKLKANRIKIYAAHLKGEKNYTHCDYRSGTAFLIGNEGNGLSEALTETADEYIKIPMKGEVESLNAAVSASLLVYEAARQREDVSNILKN